MLAAFFLIFVSAIQAQDFTFVTSGGTNTLTFCSNTNSDIVIPDNYNGLPVTAIRDSVFYGDSNLTSIALGTNLAAIGYYVFLDCANFKAITVSGQNTFLSSEDGVLFDKSKTTLLLYPVGRAGAYAIPKGVFAFSCV